MSSRSEEILKLSKCLSEAELRELVGELTHRLAPRLTPMGVEEAIAVMYSKPIPGPMVKYSREEMNERRAD